MKKLLLIILIAALAWLFYKAVKNVDYMGFFFYDRELLDKALDKQ